MQTCMLSLSLFSFWSPYLYIMPLVCAWPNLPFEQYRIPTSTCQWLKVLSLFAPHSELHVHFSFGSVLCPWCVLAS